MFATGGGAQKTVAFAPAEHKLREVLVSKITPLQNPFDSSASYYEEVIETVNIEEENNEVKPILSSTSSFKKPKLAKQTSKLSEKSSQLTEIQELKLENLVKTGKLLDLQIQNAELDLLIKKVQYEQLEQPSSD